MNNFIEKVILLFTRPDYIGSFGKGFVLTLKISVLAIIVGFTLGLIIALIETSKTRWLAPLRFLCKIYVTVIRGTPMALQLFIMFFVIFAIRDFPELITAVLAFGFNSAAYSSEIFRSGILSVDRGQHEAGLALGLSESTIFRKITFPQALKNSILPLGSELITIFKETAIVSMVGMYDLNMAAKDIGSGQNLASYIVPMFVAALFYLAVVNIITILVNLLDKKLRRGDVR